MSFSSSRLLTGSHTAYGYFLSLTQSVKAPLTLSFMTLTFLKRTDQLFCHMSYNLGLSGIFLTLRLNITGNIVSSAHWIRFLMLLCLVTGDVDLYHLIRGSRGFCQISHCTTTIFPFVVNRCLAGGSLGLCKFCFSSNSGPLTFALIDGALLCFAFVSRLVVSNRGLTLVLPVLFSVAMVLTYSGFIFQYFFYSIWALPTSQLVLVISLFWEYGKHYHCSKSQSYTNIYSEYHYLLTPAAPFSFTPLFHLFPTYPLQETNLLSV